MDSWLVAAALTRATPTSARGAGHSPAIAAASGSTMSTDDARVIGYTTPKPPRA